jgi:hypothetical protein
MLMRRFTAETLDSKYINMHTRKTIRNTLASLACSYRIRLWFNEDCDLLAHNTLHYKQHICAIHLLEWYNSTVAPNSLYTYERRWLIHTKHNRGCLLSARLHVADRFMTPMRAFTHHRNAVLYSSRPFVRRVMRFMAG